MKSTKIRNKTLAICAGGLLCLIFLASTTHGQTSKKNLVTTNPESTSTKCITVGLFSVKVPTDWSLFTRSEVASLRRQYLQQSRLIYKRYYGSSEDPAQSVDLAAFHIAGNEGAFVIVSFTVSPQANLIPLLKSQAEDNANWGVRNGYIREYLGLVPIDDENLSGFYMKAVGKSGNVQVSGGLEHKKLKNAIISVDARNAQGME